MLTPENDQFFQQMEGEFKIERGFMTLD